MPEGESRLLIPKRRRGDRDQRGTGRERKKRIHSCDAIYAIEDSANTDRRREVTSRVTEVTARAKREGCQRSRDVTRVT